MKHIAIGMVMLAASCAVMADEAANCRAAAGVYRSGVVLRGPTFAHGQFQRGVELSHTHLLLLADQDGKTYDVAIDNVFATGYDAHRAAIPAPLNSIRVRDRLELCGQLYTKGIGMHWVHTNCGIAPTPGKPDGWLKKLAADGNASQNYEGNREYCSRF